MLTGKFLTKVDYAFPEFNSLKCSPEAKQLLENLLKINPSLRPTAAAALESKWIKS